MRQQKQDPGTSPPATATGVESNNPTTADRSSEPIGGQSVFDLTGSEASDSVVSLSSGDYYHKTLGGSDIPRCGARAGETTGVARMTLYRADVEEDLDRCQRCPW